MLEKITPVILTYNEEANISRTLEMLDWAGEIVVLDSGSSDGTLKLVKEFPRTRVEQRSFDTHARQWNHAVQHTGIRTEWILALDADYVLTPELVKEISRLQPPQEVAGYRASFRYCVLGKPLRGSLYPPVTVLYRKDRSHYQQDGHTQRVIVDGKTNDLQSKIAHDDRKPLSHWLASQDRYATLECGALSNSDGARLSWADRVRKLLVVAPILAPLHALFLKGAVLDGRAGLHYAMQRMIAETILSLKLLERALNRE